MKRILILDSFAGMREARILLTIFALLLGTALVRRSLARGEYNRENILREMTEYVSKKYGVERMAAKYIVMAKINYNTKWPRIYSRARNPTQRSKDFCPRL